MSLSNIGWAVYLAASKAQDARERALRVRRDAIMQRGTYIYRSPWYGAAREWRRINLGRDIDWARTIQRDLSVTHWTRQSWTDAWRVFRACCTVGADNGGYRPNFRGFCRSIHLGNGDWRFRVDQHPHDPAATRSAAELLGIAEDGYDSDGRNIRGYDTDGYDSDGYDSDGYDSDGYDSDGRDRSGNCRYGDCGECDSCRENNDPIPAYKQADRDWKVTTTEPTYGTEVETHAPDLDGAIAAWEDRPTGWIGERDSSLDDECGVEWIGPPLTFGDYREGKTWHKWLAALRDRKFTSWDTGCCGMHVHVGRRQWSLDTQARVCIVVNHWQSLSEMVAGREHCHWAQYRAKTRDDWQNRDRYEAVNVTRETLEFRIFRGTLAWDGFSRNMQYVRSVMVWCSTAPEDVYDNEASFLAYLVENVTEYPHLVAFLREQGRIAQPTENMTEESTPCA